MDGTKVKANASRHKAMSYDRRCAAQENLEAEVKEMMGEAERVDAEEDAPSPSSKHSATTSTCNP